MKGSKGFSEDGAESELLHEEAMEEEYAKGLAVRAGHCPYLLELCCHCKAMGDKFGGSGCKFLYALCHTCPGLQHQ